jgi:hypothetical protein
MNLSSREKKIVFENVIARVGFNEQALQEYAKAISGLRGFQSQMEMNPYVPTEGVPNTGGMSRPMGDTTQGEIVPPLPPPMGNV